MPSSVVKSFASKSGKSVAEVEKMWDAVKSSLKKQGKKETDSNFYSLLVGIMKKNLKVEQFEQTSFRDMLAEMVSKDKSNLPEDRVVREINKKFKGIKASEVQGLVRVDPLKKGDKTPLEPVLKWAQDKSNKRKFDIHDAEITSFQGYAVKIYFNA